MKQLIILIMLVLIVENVDMSHKEFKISRYNFTTDSEYFNITDGSLNKTHSGAVKMNVIRDLPNLHIQIILKAMKSNIILFDKTINLCYFNREKNSNIMFRFMFANVASTAKFKFECPFKKGLYELESKAHETAKTTSLFLPGYMPMNEKILYNLIGFTKIKGQVKVIYNSTAVWTIIEVDD